MANILCIETATTVCSVALYDDERVLAYQEYHVEKSHSTLLPAIIDAVIANAGVTKPELAAVAVSEGPGSYTGLRIGVSIAKGLCYAMDVPLLAVNTLAAMASGVNKYNRKNALLCPMIDARRMEVYTGFFDNKNRAVGEIAPQIINADSFAGVLSEREVWFFGDGAEKCKDILSVHQNAVFIDNVWPSAGSMGLLAAEKFRNGVFEDAAYFEPFYLKEFRITRPKVVK